MRSARINKAAIVGEGNAKRACANIAATANAIRTVKRRADTNIAITTNIIASNAKVNDNIVVIANANKTAINIRNHIPMY